MTQIFDFFNDFIYPYYTLAVILLTWLLRAAVTKVDTSMNPKITAAIVGVLVAIPGVIYKHIIIDADHIMKLFISFAMAAFVYDYTIYFLKKRFTPSSSEKPDAHGGQGEPGTRSDKTSPS